MTTEDKQTEEQGTYYYIRPTSATEENKKPKSDHLFALGIASGIMLSLVVFVVCSVAMQMHDDKKLTKTIEDAKQTVDESPAAQAYSNYDSTEEHDDIVTEEVMVKMGVLQGLIDKYYLDGYELDDLENGVYAGMIDSLGDKYAEYYSPEDLQLLMEDSEGVYYGIGAYVGMDSETGMCVISGTMEGTPAEKAGLEPGDIIYKVDDVDTQGMDSSEVVKLIKGEEGTYTHLTLIREGEDDYVEVDVMRSRVETPTVSYEIYEDDNIGYIAIGEFDTVTVDQFTDALAVCTGSGVRGIIIDLRGNPGGSVDAVCEICRHILPKGMIVYTEDKYGKRDEYTCDGTHELNLPLVVLTNEYSASASEIMTGAIKDYHKGTVVGTTTYGKGVVQKVVSLSDGSAIKLTISKYYTPSGVCIHGTGIEPDIPIELDVDAYVDDGFDNQLDAAIQEIHRQWEEEDVTIASNE